MKENLKIRCMMFPPACLYQLKQDVQIIDLFILKEEQKPDERMTQSKLCLCMSIKYYLFNRTPVEEVSMPVPSSIGYSSVHLLA